jgi:cell division protein FtsW
VLLARKAEQVKTFSVGFVPPLAVTGIVVALLLKQPDLGTSVIIGVMALGLLFVAGTRTSYILMCVLMAVPAGWMLFITGVGWRMQRMLAFLDPWQYCQKAGYQLCESLISVGSGGVLGQGLGESRQKLFFLPEAHTDFILAIVGEELGLMGVLALVAAFSLLVWRGILAAMRARDLFGSYLAFALSSLFGLQALFNMGVVLGLLPTKGLALPFISYGGTSLMVSLFMAGVLGNISARNPEPRPSPFWGSLRGRMKAGKNRRAERGARVVIEVAPPWRRPAQPATPAPSAPLEEPASEASPQDPPGMD